jgi:predicted  nucleic acid-binding Zn-ribbon protein
MAKTYALAGLHLRYRLWIAELNHCIDIIRISQDYYAFEGKDKQDATAVTDGIEYFKKRFIELRKEIDDLRNNFHLLKMKIAADAKTMKEIDQKTYVAESHDEIKKQMIAFKKIFSGVINEFCRFEKKYF